MQANEENIAWVMEKFEELIPLPGFPQTEKGLRGIAKAFLRIVDAISDDKKNVYDVDKSCGVWVKIPGYTADQAADWLIAEILDKCERFPAPIIMRRLYEGPAIRREGGELELWHAADGRRSADMGLED